MKLGWNISGKNGKNWDVGAMYQKTVNRCNDIGRLI
jgi:hypothetical protein